MVEKSKGIAIESPELKPPAYKVAFTTASRVPKPPGVIGRSPAVLPMAMESINDFIASHDSLYTGFNPLAIKNRIKDMFS